MLEFEEFVTLAAKFIIDDDAEAMAKELKEAFRLYDKAGQSRSTKIADAAYFVSTSRIERFHDMAYLSTEIIL